MRAVLAAAVVGQGGHRARIGAAAYLDLPARGCVVAQQPGLTLIVLAQQLAHRRAVGAAGDEPLQQRELVCGGEQRVLGAVQRVQRRALRRELVHGGQQPADTPEHLQPCEMVPAQCAAGGL